MPCTDGGVPYPPTREEELDAKVPRAVLCALMALPMDMTLTEAFAGIDWAEAGVTKSELVEWWDLHRKRDHARKMREGRSSYEDRVRKRALEKLTEEEIRILGLDNKG